MAVKLQSRLVIAMGITATLMTGACAPSPTPQPTAVAPQPFATVPSDACSTANLANSVRPLNDLVRQFDDYSELASNIIQSDLVKVVPPMQAIRRSTEDVVVPSCMTDLKRYALLYMDVTLQTLMIFQQPNPDALAVGTGIASARSYHDQYALELARLLGVTVSPTGQP